METQRLEEPAAVEGDGKARGDRSTFELIRAIAADTGTLVRKEVELARLEFTAALAARVRAVAAFAVAGAFGLIVLVFLGSAMAQALDGVLTDWGARLVTAAAFASVALAAGAFGLVGMRRPPLSPEETKRTVKEDLEWARGQLRR